MLTSSFFSRLFLATALSVAGSSFVSAQERFSPYVEGEGEIQFPKEFSTSMVHVGSWFVMVKDSQNRFADNALWGDGWGWALFKPDQPEVNVASDYKADCLGCHVPAKQNDWLYVEAYPLLKK